MKIAAVIAALVTITHAHNPQVLTTSQLRRLHKTRSLCSREVHCILAQEATEGPYYIPTPLIRSNITEDRDGIPLKLNISVIDITKCAPAKGVYVDIWHADASGVYSGWAGGAALLPGSALDSVLGGPRPPPPFSHSPQDSSRFLRGVTVTDDFGNAVFDTVMPAWYEGRSTHIHIRIHTGSVEAEDGSLVGAGNIAHTGQLFFADDLVKDIAATTEPYLSHGKKLSPMVNGDDGIYLQSEGEEQVVTIEREGSILKGFVGVGIDPEADHHEDVGFGDRSGWGNIAAVLMVIVVVVVVASVLAYRWYTKSRVDIPYISLPLQEE